MIAEPSAVDPSTTFHKAESADSVSESSSTDSYSDADTLEFDQCPDDIHAPLLEKEVWNPDFHMYKHRRTHVVHLLAHGATHETFSCGLKLIQQIISRWNPAGSWISASAKGGQ